MKKKNILSVLLVIAVLALSICIIYIPLPSSKCLMVNAVGFQGVFSEKVCKKNKLFQKNSIKGLNNSKYESNRRKVETTTPVRVDAEGEKSEVRLKSGQITELPWEKDEKFLNAIKENGDLYLMGAYRTVLKDPLPGEEYNVHLAASMLQGLVINPGQVFSQNGKVGPYTEERGFRKGPTYIGSQLTTTIGGGVCKIASTLYNVTVLSDLKVVERHAHGMPVPYVPAGQDATVAYGARDFKFMNSTSEPVLIWAQGIDNTLYIAFYGKVHPRKVEWHHETLNVQPAPKNYRVNENLNPGSEKVILEGMDGLTVKSRLTFYNTDGSTETKDLGISYYKPMAYIIEKGK